MSDGDAEELGPEELAAASAAGDTDENVEETDGTDGGGAGMPDVDETGPCAMLPEGPEAPLVGGVPEVGPGAGVEVDTGGAAISEADDTGPAMAYEPTAKHVVPCVTTPRQSGADARFGRDRE